MASPSDTDAAAGGSAPAAAGGGIPPAESPRPGAAGTGDSGIGASPVGAAGIVIAAVIILAAAVLAVYCLIAVWPSNANAATTLGHLFGARVTLGRDQQLFVIVVLAGVLGGLVHSARSLYWYAGNRLLRRSWLLMYACLPVVGGALAVVFYLILRGGLLTGAATAAQVNFFGFAAVSALVGLFSSEAAEKLKQIFSTVLAPALSGRDRLPEGSRAVDGFEPGSAAVGSTVTIRGRNLSGTTEVLFPGAVAPAAFASATEVRCQVPSGASTGRIRLAVGDRIVSVPGVFRVEDDVAGVRHDEGR